MSGRASPDAALANRVDVLEAKSAPLADRIAVLERRVADNAAAARTAGERADRATALFDEMKRSVAERNSPPPGERSIVEGLADRLNALEARDAALRRKQEELDRAATAPAAAAPDEPVRAAMIALALRDTVERGDPYTVELAAARSFGFDEKSLAAVEPFAVTGVPARSELLRGFSTLLPELLRVSIPATHDGGYLDRLQASAARMMNIRPVGDRSGDDPAIVIARIESRMTNQDIAGMVAELDNLPVPAREVVQPWRTRALARQGALDTVRRVAAGSLAKLGGPTVRESLPQ